MSPVRRILLLQFLVVIAALKIVDPFPVHPLLSTAMRLIALGLVADLISIVALQLRQLPPPHGLLHYLCSSVPFVAGLSAELAIAVLALKCGEGAVAQRLLAGTVHAKLLATGGLCLALGMSRLQSSAVDRHIARTTTSAWFLSVASIIAFASPANFEGTYGHLAWTPS